MTAREAAQEAWKNLKDRPLKEKFKHIWTYYRVPIIVSVCVVAMLTSILHSVATRKDVVLNGYCLNVITDSESAAILTEAFMTDAAIDPQTHEVCIHSGLSTYDAGLGDTLQVLSAHIAAQEVDFILSDEETCQAMMDYDYYSDLSTLLDDHQQALLSPYFLYAERAILSKEAPSDETTALQTAFADPETLDNPIPVALRLPAKVLSPAYTFSDETVTMLILPNAPHIETLVQFLEYLLTQ